jgi:hypothetical protein
MLLYRYYHLLGLPRLLSPRGADLEAGWSNPHPDDDFSQIFYEGDTFPIAWVGWPATTIDSYLKGTNVADLWITSFDYDQTPFTQLLTSGFFPILPWFFLPGLLTNLRIRQCRCLGGRFV